MPDPHSSKNRPVGKSRRWLSATAVVASVVLAAGLVAWYKDTRKSVTLRIHAEWGEGELLQLGRSVYGTHCAICHGRDLQGHPDWHPKGDVLFKPPPLDGTAGHRSSDELFGIISRGFSNILTEREILATIAYLQFKYDTNRRLRAIILRLEAPKRSREQTIELPEVDE